MSDGVASIPPAGDDAPRFSAFGPFRFDRRNGVLLRDGVELPLAAKQRDLLEYLLARPGLVVSKEELLDHLWSDTTVTDHSLTEAVRALRKTLGDNPRRPRFIQTAHRRGYRFIAEVSDGESLEEQPETGRQPGRRRRTALASAAVAVVALAVGLLLGSATRFAATEPQPVRRLELTTPGGMVFGYNHLYAGIDLSDDGMTVAYLSDDEERGIGLYVRRLDREREVRIETAGSPYQPALSPDGRQVAFFELSPRSEGENRSALKVSDLDGGSPVTLAAGLTTGTGANFTRDGSAVVFTAADPAGVWRVAVDGTTRPERIISADPDQTFYWPQLLSDEETIIVTSHRYRADGLRKEVVALSLADGTQRPLLDGGGRPRLTVDGHLLVGRNRQVFAAPFDKATHRVSGRLVPVLADVATDDFSGYAAYDVAADGSLVFLEDRRVPASSRIALVDRAGNAEPVPTIPSFVMQLPQLSPDGRRAAFVARRDGARDIYLADLENGGSPTRLTFDQWTGAPIWTPEGGRVTYGRFSGSVYDLYSTDVATRREQPLLRSEYSKYPSSWSPDGGILAYSESNPETDSDIWLLPVATGTPVPFLRTPDEEWGAVFSPDGRLLAYHTDESGRYEVWIRPVPEDLTEHDPGPGGAAWRVSTDCGGWPSWSADGRELFFRHCDTGTLEPFFVASIEAGPQPVIGRPRRLFAGEYHARIYGSPSFSVTADGRLLLLTVESAGSPEKQLHLQFLQNWFIELDRAMSGDR